VDCCETSFSFFKIGTQSRELFWTRSGEELAGRVTLQPSGWDRIRLVMGLKTGESKFVMLVDATFSLERKGGAKSSSRF
jgi:hypothetical protein